MKILSVIIPFYNSEDTLEVAAMSCLDEGILDDVEVIMVNDGSRDNSLKVARGIESRYPNSVIVIDKPNGGKGSCMNAGIAKATGKYLRELDSDDYFEANSIKMFISRLKVVDVDVVYTDYLVNNKATGVIDRIKASEFVDGKVLFMNEIDMPNKLYRMHSLTYSLTLLNQIKFKQSEGISYTDTEYVYYPLINANSFIYFDLILYVYILGNSGQSVSIESTKKKMSHVWTLIDKFSHDQEYKTGNKNSHLIRSQILSTLLRSIAVVYLLHSDYEKDIDNRLRNTINYYKTNDKLAYYLILKWFGKFRYVILEWLFCGKIHFFLRKLLFH